MDKLYLVQDSHQVIVFESGMAASNPIPAIFDLCTPHQEVIEGELQEDQFAAALSEVAFDHERAPEIYSDPAAFFEKTHPTDGLQQVLQLLAKRYVGATTEEFSQTPGFLSLDTVFGGGKTHSQIASYHFSQSPSAIENLQAFLDDEALVRQFEEISADLNVRVGVFEGGYVSSTSTKCTQDPDAPDTQTMWGELAYQLAGREGYELFRENDETRMAPGKNEINDLLDLIDDPALVLIDEVAQYYEQAASVSVEGSTLVKQNNSFLWSLVRATQNTDDITVILSVAKTAFEDRAEEIEREVLARVEELDNISERTEQEITPAEDDEVAAIIRKRLFETVDESRVPDVLDAYMSFYRDNGEILPDSVSTAEYRDDLERSYPLHPSMLRLLSDEIDSLPNFQRTRGALKLVARAVHYAWKNRDTQRTDRHFLRIYDMHPSDDSVWSTLLDLFEDGDVDLRTAVKSDIYKQGSLAACEREDANWTRGGKPPVATRLGTTILWKSIVSGGNNMRGVRRQKLFELIGSPTIEFDHYRDALQHLQEPGSNPETEAFFLHETETGVLRFKGEAKLSRVRYNEEKQLEDGVVSTRLQRAVEGALGGGTFETLYGKESPHEVPDDAETVRLCVMSFETLTASSEDPLDDVKEDGTVPTLSDFTGQSAGSQSKRIFKNNLLFLVADEQYVEKAKESARRQKAYERLINDETGHELTEAQRDELREQRDENANNLGQAVRNTYRHIIFPEDNELEATTLSATQSGDGKSLHDIVYDALEDLDLLIPRGEDAYGEPWFTQHIWRANPESMTTDEIREAFAKRTDLPILLHPKPLRKTITKVVREGPYTFWDKGMGRGRSAPDATAPSLENDRVLPDAEEISAGITENEVSITDTQVVYRDAATLLSEHEFTFEADEPVVTPPGGDDDDDDDGGDENAFSGAEFEFVDGPTSVKGAFSTVGNDLDGKIQSIRDLHGLASSEIGVTADEISFTIEGEEVWSQAWFLARSLDKVDEIAEATAVTFSYDARRTTGPEASEAGFTYSGSVSQFATHFGVNLEPDAFVNDDGEVDGTAQITVDTARLSDDSWDATVGELKDHLSELSGITDLTLRVSGTIERAEEAGTVTEVSAE